MLIEVGLGTYFVRWDKERPDNVTSGLVRVTEQCTAGCAINGNVPGLNFRAEQWTNNWGQAYNPLASISYVTGAHSLKFGYQGFIGIDQNSFTNTTNLAYRVNNGVPNQLTMYGDPIIRLPRAIQTSFYAQEQWTHGRLTLQGAVRYDRAGSHFLDEQVGPTRFIPTPLFFPRQDGVEGYQDLTPRAGGSTTCSATARPRSRPTSANTSKRQGHRVELRHREPDVAHRAERQRNLDGQQRQFQAGLRSAEPVGAGSPRDRRRRLCRLSRTRTSAKNGVQQHV